MAKAILNGKPVDSEDPAILLTDPGWLYGATLFETIPLYGGSPYLLHAHWDRLVGAAGLLGFRPQLSEQELTESLELLARNGSDPRLLVRLTLSKSGLWALTARVPRIEAIQFARGWNVVLLAPLQNNRAGLWGGVKSGNYWGQIIARRKLEITQGDEGLFVTSEGRLLDASFTTLFLVRKGELLTPALLGDVLPSVTRGRIIELARGATEVAESILTVEDLWRADECFVCGSGAEVTPVRRLEGRSLPEGSPGPVTRKVMAALAQDIQRETGAQASVARFLPGLID